METLFNAIVALIASEMQVHPEAINAVYHYFFGGGKERHLPEEYHQETKKAIAFYLKLKWKHPNWRGINCVEFLQGGEWLTTLDGVIGDFNFDFEWEDNKLVAHCWDKWDFNLAHEEEKEIFLETFGISIPSTKMDKLIIATAKMMGIEVRAENGSLKASEEQLATLNKGREYYTRWSVEFGKSELETLCQEVFKSGFNPDSFDWKHGGLPKSWIKERAIKTSVEKRCKKHEEKSALRVCVEFFGESCTINVVDLNLVQNIVATHEFPMEWDSLKAIDEWLAKNVK